MSQVGIATINAYCGDLLVQGRLAMFRIMTGLVLALTCGLGMSAQAEVEFIDYDYTRFSQDVTECDRLA